jgi:predicted nucleotidyltransferase
MITIIDHKIVERLKALMLERRLPIEEVIVFGSRARGDFEEDSDLDVLVIVQERTLAVVNAIRECAWEVGLDSDRYIQTVIRDKAEMEESPFRASFFVQTVRQEGIRI